MSEHRIAAVCHVSSPGTVPVDWGLDNKMHFSTSVTIIVLSEPTGRKNQHSVLINGAELPTRITQTCRTKILFQ